MINIGAADFMLSSIHFFRLRELYLSKPKLKITPTNIALDGVVINFIKSTKILLETKSFKTCNKVPKAIKIIGRIIGANDVLNGGKLLFPVLSSSGLVSTSLV